MAVCGGQLECCSRTCSARCGECRGLPGLPKDGFIQRSKHISHPCERLLYCQHRCGLACSKEHECNSKCQEKCSQSCDHHACQQPCSEPCPPCMHPCSWACVHQTCPVVCGAVSSFIPETSMTYSSHTCRSVLGSRAMKCAQEPLNVVTHVRQVCSHERYQRTLLTFNSMRRALRTSEMPELHVG
jgi:hypothetical protein